MREQELFDLIDALHEFESLNLGHAAHNLLRALHYPVNNATPPDTHGIDYFLFFVAQKRASYNAQEANCLKKIIQISHLDVFKHQSLIQKGTHSNGAITFLSLEINSSKRDRTEDALMITRILKKAYNHFVIIIIKCEDSIAISSCLYHESTNISDWYNSRPSIEEVHSLIKTSYLYLGEANSVQEFYENLVYAFSRDYLIYHESFEYQAFELIEPFDFFENNEYISKQYIMDNIERNRGYYKNRYTDDYIEFDESPKGKHELNDDDWTAIELEESEDLPEDLRYEFAEVGIDYSDIDEETLNDPEKLLKWLEKRDSSDSIRRL